MGRRQRIEASTREKVIALAMLGVAPSLIWQQLGAEVKLSTIYQILAAARKAGRDIPRFPPTQITTARAPHGTVFRISVSVPAHRDRLRLAAARRGFTRAQLLNRLVSTILEESLVDSVLDDQVVTDA